MKEVRVKCCIDGCTRLVPEDIEICAPCFRKYMKSRKEQTK